MGLTTKVKRAVGKAARAIIAEAAYHIKGYSIIVLRSDEFYVPPLGKEDLKLYSDKQNIHHLVRYVWAVDVLKELNPRTVLDIACGCGFGTAQIADALPASRIVGADRNKHAMAYARRHYSRKNSEFVRMDVNQLTLRFEQGTYDTITSFETIEHLEDQERFVADLASLLKPGGVLLISAPTHENPVKDLANSWHVKEPTYKEIEVLLTSHFEVVRQGKALPHAEVFERINARFEKPVYNVTWNPCWCQCPAKKKSS